MDRFNATFRGHLHRTHFCILKTQGQKTRLNTKKQRQKNKQKKQDTSIMVKQVRPALLHRKTIEKQQSEMKKGNMSVFIRINFHYVADAE